MFYGPGDPAPDKADMPSIDSRTVPGQDLCKHPERNWSPFDCPRCLQGAGQTATTFVRFSIFESNLAGCPVGVLALEHVAALQIGITEK